MKKILKSVFAIAIAALAFTSCDDVPMPYDKPSVNTGGTTYEGAVGTGTQADPYNVAGVLTYISTLEAGVESEQAVYIKGKVASIEENYDGQYKNATFNITDEGTTHTFTVYRANYLGNQKYSSGDVLKIGDEVVVYGNVVNFRGNTPETVQNKAYLYSLNGEGGGGGAAGEAKGDGTKLNPYNPAGVIAYINTLGADTESPDNVYIQGKVVSIATSNNVAQNYDNGSYGSATFDIAEEGAEGTTFTVYRAYYLENKKWEAGAGDIVKVGDQVIICGKVVNYRGNTPETVQNKAYLYSLNGNTERGSVTPTPQPGGANLLTNGDFEAWTGGLPDNWKPASTAGNATLSQSSDAHGGSYAVSVAHATANKRLGHEEITLKAGTYQASCWVKADDAAGAKISVGYVVVTNGKVSSSDDYKYEVKDQMLSNEWSNVTYSFTLSSETTISLLVMVNKASSANVIVDDYTLTTSNGGLADGNDGDTPSSDVTYTLTTTIANGKYIIAANNSGTYEVATPLSSAYGYIQKSDVTPSGSTIATSSANEFTLTAVTGGYTIQDASGKYYYMTGNYNSFNVQETVPSEGHIWSITVNEDQTVTITNVAKNKTIQYDTQYNSYGAYGETKGIFPNLFKK